MKLKKVTIILLLIIFFVSQISWITFNNFSYATENDRNFHYDQLDSEAKIIYDAIYNMYIQGILKTGVQDYDLVEHGLLTEAQIKEYENGNLNLISAMNAARYAFYADYPEIFYVNFQVLTIRTTKDSNNKYHAYIGSGRHANYYVPGFTNQEEVEKAISDFDSKVSEIVEKANNIEVDENQDKIVQQIKLVHNEIIHTAGYRLESDCADGNEGFLGTPYGALVKKEAVCEGYARALKTVLDKIGIKSILVQGMHQSEGAAAVPHMWNYVQIEKTSLSRSSEKIWYAIDCTLDDPFLRDSTIDTTDPDFIPGSDIKEGFENTRYCMVGTESMNIEHTVLETVEAAGNYTFKYPELNMEDYGIDNVTNVNGLLVKFKQNGTETEEYKAGDFYISYNDKGYAEAAKEGKYILIKYHEYLPGDDVWNEGNWGYMNPELYAPGAFNDNGNHIYITIPNSEYIEFAVTTLAPGTGLDAYTYKGDGSDFVAESGKLYNPNGIYKAPPYIKYQTPAPTQTLTVGPTYHIDVTYDEDLVLAEGATEVGYRMESTGTTGVAESKIENFTFDGKRRITFDLTFSKMFADDNSMYRIYITGVVGKNSNKVPNHISYGAANTIGCASRMNAAKSWNLFATPTLLENEDLSLNGWETSDGKAVSEKLKNRIALVTTRTTQTEKESMNNLMENELSGQELITSETYNISLNACKKYVVKTGHKLRLSLGFPAGYGPNDAGVTFKAYHFKRDNQGNITEVEEIPCVVTKYGLIITCDSFSPFAIAVVENDGTTPQDKTTIVSAVDGGQINGANRDEGNIITLKENESVNLNVVPNEGYEIETINVCGKDLEVTNKDSMDITVNYEDIVTEDNIIQATFVAKEVIQKEEERQETVVEPPALPEVPNINTPEFSTSIVKSEEKVIRPGDEFSVNVNIHDFKNIDKGLIALGGQLEYDTNVLERIEISGQNNWDISGGFNELNFKFITDNNNYITDDSTVFTIKFKAKETIEETTNTIIKVKNIVASNAITDIRSKDTEINIEIQRRPDRFTSEVYSIGEEYVTKITAGTTVSEFKSNVDAYPNITIKDSTGKQLQDNDIIATGMTVEVGETYHLTLVVTGDIDGNGEITITDLAKLKLHYIEKELLSGANLKAADMNYDNEITITDLAQLKLILIADEAK